MSTDTFHTLFPLQFAHVEVLAGHAPARVFRLFSFSGETPSWVVQRVSSERWPKIEPALRLTHVLAEQGAPVLMPVAAQAVDERTGELLMDWCDPLVLDESMMPLIIQGVERLYSALDTLPQQDVQQQAARQWQRYQQALPEAGRCWPQLDWSLLELLNVRPRRLHGDMNLGNIRLHQRGLVWLDFEDVMTAWWNPVVDLGLLYERLYHWARRDDPALCLQLEKTLLPWACELCGFDWRTFFDGMAANALRALLILRQAQPAEWVKREEAKFLWLYAQAQQQKKRHESR